MLPPYALSWRETPLAPLAGEADGLTTIDVGAGHSSNNETLCGRFISALTSQALLNQSSGAAYIERNWPPAFKQSGAWPLTSLRQSFLNGSLARLVDPDTTLRSKIVEFVARGEFGLASGHNPDGGYVRTFFTEAIDQAEVAFHADVYLLMADRVATSQPYGGASPLPAALPEQSKPEGGVAPPPPTPTAPKAGRRALRLRGNVPPKVWNMDKDFLISLQAG